MQYVYSGTAKFPDHIQFWVAQAPTQHQDVLRVYTVLKTLLKSLQNNFTMNKHFQLFRLIDNNISIAYYELKSSSFEVYAACVS